MRYFKSIKDNYIIGVGEGNIGEEISLEEYNEITKFFHQMPTAPMGFCYHLRDNLTWECRTLTTME